MQLELIILNSSAGTGGSILIVKNNLQSKWLNQNQVEVEVEVEVQVEIYLIFEVQVNAFAAGRSLCLCIYRSTEYYNDTSICTSTCRCEVDLIRSRTLTL